MLTLKNNIITICKYKLIKDDRIKYDNEVLEGYEVVEEYDITNEIWLDGVYCETIHKAKEWLALGYIPKTEKEIMQETIDTLVLSMLEV